LQIPIEIPMNHSLQRCFVLVLALSASPTWLSAQPAPMPAAQPPASAQPLPQDQLDALLAPIALYPDQLLSQILIASTYPLDVVEAARFVQQNPGLNGDALNKALENKPWDPSVLSLTAFPQVLAMMNDKLEWTQQLGDAFLANEAQVMQTAQSLRARAQAAGNLQSTEQQKVIVQEKTIIIEPAQPQFVYVPVYNPTVIYGPWWVPAYRPWFWYPPPIYGYPPIGAAFSVGFVWGSAWAISSNHWGWANPNWRGGSININVNNNYFMNRPQYNNRYQNGNWQHNADQRRGVAYRDTNVQNRYRPSNPGAQTREAYRGRDVSQPATAQADTGRQRPTGQPGGGGAQRPTTTDRPASAGSGTAPATRPGSVSNGAPVDRSGSMTRPTPTYNASQSRPQTQQYSNRGAQSRAAMNTPAQGGGNGGPTRGGGARGGGGGDGRGGAEGRGSGEGGRK
jgi:hypothetical protein